MNYRFEFSWKGFLVFLLPMIPNIFYFIIPVKATEINQISYMYLDIIEHVSQAIFVFVLIFIVNKQINRIQNLYTIGIGIALFVYYVLWIFHFAGRASSAFYVGMAVIPVIYFILSEIWLNNIVAIVPTIIFGIVHITITFLNTY